MSLDLGPPDQRSAVPKPLRGARVRAWEAARQRRNKGEGRGRAGRRGLGGAGAQEGLCGRRGGVEGVEEWTLTTYYRRTTYCSPGGGGVILGEPLRAHRLLQRVGAGSGGAAPKVALLVLWRHVDLGLVLPRAAAEAEDRRRLTRRLLAHGGTVAVGARARAVQGALDVVVLKALRAAECPRRLRRRVAVESRHVLLAHGAWLGSGSVVRIRARVTR